MLSYRHAFHAGNFADILKHTTLSLIIDSLKNKEKPFTIIDTHAGAGLYDLTDEKSVKTQEAQNGIILLNEKLKTLKAPTEMNSYLNAICTLLKDNQYPGSPIIEKTLMRKDDRLVLMELHNTEIEILKTNMKCDAEQHRKESKKHIEIYHENGFSKLNSLVPPQTKRGLVLTDPSYETSEDWSQTTIAIQKAHKKWQTGIFAIWYPLLEHRSIEISTLKNTLRIVSENIPISKKNLSSTNNLINTNTKSSTNFIDNTKKESHIIFAELCTSNTTENGRLYGSGMCIINPPWQLDEKLKVILPFLQKVAGENANFSLEC